MDSSTKDRQARRIVREISGEGIEFDIGTDFVTVQKVNKGHGRLEIRTLTTSEMLNPYSTWPGLAQVYQLRHQFQWWRSGRPYRTSDQLDEGTHTPVVLSIRRKA